MKSNNKFFIHFIIVFFIIYSIGLGLYFLGYVLEDNMIRFYDGMSQTMITGLILKLYHNYQKE